MRRLVLQLRDGSPSPCHMRYSGVSWRTPGASGLAPRLAWRLWALALPWALQDPIEGSGSGPGPHFSVDWTFSGSCRVFVLNAAFKVGIWSNHVQNIQSTEPRVHGSGHGSAQRYRTHAALSASVDPSPELGRLWTPDRLRALGRFPVTPP